MAESNTTEIFAKAIAASLAAYKKGKLDFNLLDTDLELFLASSDGKSEESCTQIKTLIEGSGIPTQPAKRLLFKLDSRLEPSSNTKRSGIPNTTSEVTAKPDSGLPQASTHMETPEKEESFDQSDSSGSRINQKSTSDSGLLRRLMQWNEDDRGKTIEANEIIRDTYQLESRIGVGGMGEVWKAIDLIQDAGDARDKYVAIKFLNREIRRHPDALKALVREFARYRKLIHHNIVKAYELNRDEDAVFLVMEFLPGISLTAFIKQHPSGISLKQAKPIIKGMCDALHYAHEEGIIHLDFKPSNVFVDTETGHTKVIDFGIARLAEQHDREKTRFDPGVLGAITKTYASKEMLAEAEPDPRDDVYGLACVVYELLSGRHPFKVHNAMKAELEKLLVLPIDGLSQSQNRALMKALAFNRKNRTPTPAKFYEGLFADEAMITPKSRKQLLIGGVFIAAILFGLLAYNGYDAWRTNSIEEGIYEGQREAISLFIELPLDTQLDLLNRAPLRKALVEIYRSKAGVSDDIFGYLNQFDRGVRDALFKDQDIKKILIDHSIKQINHAVANDLFDKAVDSGEKITSIYPDSKQLEEVVSNIAQKKRSRIQELERQYRQRLGDRSQSLVGLLPYFKETRAALARISPTHEFLNEPKLGARYDSETSLALKQKNIALAEQLLSDWGGLLKDESKERNQLQKLLNHLKEVFALVGDVTRSSKTKMPKVIETLNSEGDNIRRDVLKDSKVKEKLLTYYDQAANRTIREGRYTIGTGIIDHGIKLFSSDNETQNTLNTFKDKIARARTLRLQHLNEQYWKIVDSQDPDVGALQKLVREVTTIDSNNELMSYPGIRDTFSGRIDSAINGEQFDVAQRSLEKWVAIIPADKENDRYKTLWQKRDDSLKRSENRAASIKQILSAIDNEDVPTVTATIARREESLNSDDYQRVLGEVDSKVIDYYVGASQKAMNADKFGEAQEIANIALMSYPGANRLLSLRKAVANAKADRIRELIAEFSALLSKQELVAKEVFAPLSKIHFIDNEYIENHSHLFNEIKARVQSLARSDDSLQQVPSLVSQWDGFIQGTKSSNQLKDIFKKAKNFVAIKCLHKARTLKAQEQCGLANEFLMFGISLDPVPSVLNSLENELQIICASTT